MQRTIFTPVMLAGLAAIGLTTCACSGGSPGSPATHTVTITAPPSATQPASAATTQPAVSTSAPTQAAAAGCLTRYLNGSIGLTQGTAGAEYVVIRFKNLNNVPCTLYGYPGVAQANGHPVTDVGQPSTEDPTTARRLVTLAPGGYAYATLKIEDAGNFPASQCTPKPAHWLAVIPPNQTIPLYIFFSTTACKGSAKILQVTAVRPGTGGGPV